MARRNRRRPSQTRRRESANAATFFAPTPDDLGLRPLSAAAGAEPYPRSLLITAMSQELRSPMNAVLGYAHLLATEQGQQLTPQQRDDLRQLQASAERLAHAIDGVIELSRLESGQVDLAIEPTDLIALAAEARRRVLATAALPDERIALAHGVGPLRANVDPMRLLESLAAVVRDLLRLSPNRPAAIAVERDGEDVVVAIAAKPDEAPSPRQPARRPAGALPWGAPALDIAAAARLLELLGGAIAVEADPDAGSRVIMRLPLAPDEPARLGSRQASE